MKRLVCATLAVFAAVFASAAGAQVFDTPPPPSAPREAIIGTPIEQTLENGLRVIVAQRQGLPLVTTTLLIRAGGVTDPPRLAGLADMTSNMLTKGTRSRSAPQIAQAAEALGSSLGAQASWDSSSISMTITSPRVPEALALIADVAMNPAFANAEIERYRKQAIDALRVAYSRPGTIARYAAQRALFGDGAYGHAIDGSPGSIMRITRADLLRQHRAKYRPDNAVLVFAGDIDPASALELARKQYGAWRAPATPIASASAVEGTPIAAKAILVDMPEAGQAGVVIALPAIKRSSPDYIAGSVASAVLGGGYSSRLNLEIRVKRGLSYGARAAFDARRAGGLLTLSAQTKNPSAFEVVQLMLGEMNGLAKAAPDTAELEARKANLIGGFSRSLETTAGLASRIATLVTNDVPLSELPKTISAIQRVGAGEVQDFARNYWQTPQVRIVVAGDGTKIGDELAKTYPDLLRVPIDRFDVDNVSLMKK